MPSVSKNILWLSVSRIAALLMLFFAYTQLFRYLGPFQTGQYQFVLSLVTIFGIVADLGISQYVTKKIAENTHLAKKYFHSFLAAEVVLAVVIYIALISFVTLRGYETIIRQAIAVAGVGLLLYGLTIPFLTVLSAFQDMRRVAVINFLASLVNVGVIFTAIAFGQSIVFLAMQQIIFGVLALVLYSRFIKSHIPEPELLSTFRHVDWTLLKKILIAALPFALLVSFSTIYNRVDVLLITKFLNYEATGLYTAAYKFVDLLNFFPAVVSHSLYPAFASLMAQGAVGQVRELLEKYLRFLIFAALPIAFGGTVLSKELVTLVAGPEFIESAGVLSILVWAIALLFIYIVANSLVISQLTKYAVMITGVNVVINIIGNILLLPVIGIKGAAIMTVVSESLQALFYFYFIKRYITSFDMIKYLWKPLIAAGTMGAVLWYIRSLKFGYMLGLDTGFAGSFIYLALLIAVGVLVYTGMLAVMKFFTKDDVQFAKKMITRNA